jgi:hypothetical protein
VTHFAQRWAIQPAIWRFMKFSSGERPIGTRDTVTTS